MPANLHGTNESPVRAVFPKIVRTAPFARAHAAALGFKKKTGELLADVYQSYADVVVGHRYEKCLSEMTGSPMAESMLFGLHFSRKGHGAERHNAKQFVEAWRAVVAETLRRVGHRQPTEELVSAVLAGRKLVRAIDDPLSTDGPVSDAVRQEPETARPAARASAPKARKPKKKGRKASKRRRTGSGRFGRAA